MTVWALEAYDTESHEARYREYTSSAARARDWELVPKIPFTDSGHGIVFSAREHRGKRKPVGSRYDQYGGQLCRDAEAEIKRIREDRKRRATIGAGLQRG